MLLRASGEMAGEPVDLAVVHGDREAAGVPHSAALLEFVEAVLGEDDARLDAARQALRAAVGEAGAVDTAAVVSSFSKMDRIADATGIPLDASLVVMAGDLRQSLELGRFASAANTPEASALLRTAGRLIAPLRPLMFRAMLAIRRRHHAGDA